MFLYEEEGGYFDPVSACQDLHEALTAHGVDIRFNGAVMGVDTTGGMVSGVQLADGCTLATPVVVNAAGPWGPGRRRWRASMCPGTSIRYGPRSSTGPVSPI